MKSVILGLILLATAATCGGSPVTVSSRTPSASPSPTPTQIGPLVLTPRGCSWQGPGQASAGLFSIHVVDQTKGGFAVDLWLLDQGHAYSELVAHIKEEQRRAAAGEQELGHPAFATLVARWRYGAGEVREQRAELESGTYGFVCFPNTDKDINGIWVTGPLTVAKSP